MLFAHYKNQNYFLKTIYDKLCKTILKNYIANVQVYSSSPILMVYFKDPLSSFPQYFTESVTPNKLIDSPIISEAICNVTEI